MSGNAVAQDATPVPPAGLPDPSLEPGDPIIANVMAQTLNVRTQPEGEQIGTLTAGNTVSLSARWQDLPWVLVDNGEIRGWVLAYYLRLVNADQTMNWAAVDTLSLPISQEIVGEQPVNQLTVENAETVLVESVALRDLPSNFAGEVVWAGEGQGVTVGEVSDDGDWVKVVVDTGGTGWIPVKMLQDSSFLATVVVSSPLSTIPLLPETGGRK